MKAFHQYWTFSAIRGAVTLLASFSIVAVPQIASLIFNAPLAIALAINCLATFLVFDGGVMVLLAKLLPARAENHRALYGQAIVSVSCGALLYLVGGGGVGPQWLVWIVASQAALASIGEFLVARDTHRQYRCLSCYATAIALVTAAVALPFAHGLDDTAISLVLAAYVGLYGTCELALGARMLFGEYRIDHPATMASTAWTLTMSSPIRPSTQTAVATVASRTCEACPADQLCHDDSPQGQLAKIMAEHCPAIVRVTRVGALLAEPAARVVV